MPAILKKQTDQTFYRLTVGERFWLVRANAEWPRRYSGILIRSILLLANMMAMIFMPIAYSQCASAGHSSELPVLCGQVFNLAHQPVADAVVRLQQDKTQDIQETRTGVEGSFVLTVSSSGTYTVSAEKSGMRSERKTWTSSSPQSSASLQLIIEFPNTEEKKTNSSSTAVADLMDFADKPNFTVAGVTDWTAVGGHGTDASVHTSEVLARETLDLRPSGANSKPADVPNDIDTPEMERRLSEAVSKNPKSAATNQNLGEFYLRAGRVSEAIQPLRASYAIDPSRVGVEYSLTLALEKTGNLSEANQHASNLLRSDATADVHRLAAIIDEKSGDPLGAVHEFEIAAKLDPSEQNYFEWGSELLLHRALTEAEQVLSKGAQAYPKSSRMLVALGSALLGGALYEQAAERLCEASDLNPTAMEPYMFLGKIEMVSPSPLPCIQPRMARFADLQPNNALANYYYAIALLKGPELPPNPQTKQESEGLLEKAIKLDPKCGEAYLQLGILSWSRQQLDKAVQYYTSAIVANPELSEAHYRLGLTYDRLHQPEKAKAEFALHDEIEKQQANAIEQQRRAVKQFRVVPSELPKGQPVH